MRPSSKEMYLARRLDREIRGHLQAPLQERRVAGTRLNLNEKARSRPSRIASARQIARAITRPRFVDGICLAAQLGRSYENVAVLVAIGVAPPATGEGASRLPAERSYRSAGSWREFFSWLRGAGSPACGCRHRRRQCRGCSVRSRRCFPGARYRRYARSRFYQALLGRVPVTGGERAVARMLKAIHARGPARRRTREREQRRWRTKLDGTGGSARPHEDGARRLLRTLAYTPGLPAEHWRRIRTNNGIERISANAEAEDGES